MMQSRSSLLMLGALTAVILVVAPGCAAKKDAGAQPAAFVSLADPDAAMSDQQLLIATRRAVTSYLATYGEAAIEVKDQASTIDERITIQTLYVGTQSALINIASGPDAELNLLDLLASVTLGRIVLEEYWIPEVFGEAGAELVRAAKTGEQAVWGLADRVLDQEQQDTLRDLILSWREANPEIRYVQSVRFGSFAKELGEEGVKRSAALLGNLALAASEAEEMRAFAERALWISGLLPYIVQTHTELVFLRIAAEPEMRAILRDEERFVSAIEDAAATFAEIPVDLEVQTQAAIDRFFDNITSEREALTESLAQASPRTSQMLDTMLASIEASDALINDVNRMLVGAAERRRPGHQRFDPGEYRELALATGASAERVSQTIAAVERLLGTDVLENGAPGVTELLATARRDVESVVNHAFRLALILAFVVAALFFVATLLLRKMAPAT